MTTFYPREQFFFRWAVYIFGLVVMSLGVALIIRADLGASPWDVLHIGLTMQFGLTIGTWTVIMGFFMLITATMMTKEWPRAGAYLNMVLVGLFVDIHLLLISTPAVLALQTAFLAGGILLMGLGIGIYISPRCGAGPRDSFMIAVSERTGMGVSRVRGLMELTVLAGGWMLGGPVFLGTIVFSLTIGHVTGKCLPLCQSWMDRRMERGISVENIN
ncbi:YczE/YyaS/YitT family protein [Alteribacter natronophilus]|uniref:YczE/YyaS/YitT family protein n=1 Tax=Alteribacter natronophilus TaxID=2583810 RepID=UPI00110EB308|nr:YitT family protein [Alteribacter natronophilus]TMW73957.1 YitT family protein [Alteribacter natronophilus]